MQWERKRPEIGCAMGEREKERGGIYFSLSICELIWFNGINGNVYEFLFFRHYFMFM